MEPSPQLQYIKEQIEDEIALYTSRKTYNRKWALAFTVVPATLAASATVFIGASETFGGRWLPVLAMIATGVASIIGTWEALFSNRKLWKVNNAALTGLYEIRSDIAYRERRDGAPIGQDEADEFFTLLKNVLRAGEDGYQAAVGKE